VPKVPSLSDFWEKSDFSNHAQGAQEDFWEKSDFSNRAQGAIDLRFLGKNRISQTVPKVPKKL
jgi:hypothetical protein